MLTAEKYAALLELMGGDRAAVEALLADVARTDKAAQAAGVAYKAAPAAPAALPPAVAAALARLRAALGDAEVAAALGQLAEDAELKQRDAARAATVKAARVAQAAFVNDIMRRASGR